MKINTRAYACQVLLTVIKEGKPFQTNLIKSENSGFIAYLCFGVLRYYFRLEKILSLLLKHPLKDKDLDIKLLLMLGLFQVFDESVENHAAINETVEACKVLKKDWAKGLINGVLRQAQRQNTLLSNSDEAIQTAHPPWLVSAFKKAWPDHWQNIIEANLAQAPLTLRVNVRKTTREKYLQLLNENNIFADLCEISPVGIKLQTAMNVDKLPGFAEGLVSVQDEAAQLAATLFDLQPGQTILDACAAPGGKTAHLLESQEKLSVVAIDNDPQRVELIHQTLNRLNLKAEVLCKDAMLPDKSWQFDGILLDAPCSATGVIRRHPDIKIHRRPQDISTLIKQQKLLLEKLWPTLKPGGTLVYATCSILPEENVEQMESFMKNHSDAQENPIEATWGVSQKIGRQILTGEHNMDGFYYARIIKQLT